MKRRETVMTIVLGVLVPVLGISILRATREPESSPDTISVAESCAQLAHGWCRGLHPKKPTTATDRVGTEQRHQQLAPWNTCRNSFASRCSAGRQPGLLTIDQHERLHQAILLVQTDWTQ